MSFTNAEATDMLAVYFEYFQNITKKELNMVSRALIMIRVFPCVVKLAASIELHFVPEILQFFKRIFNL